jgi:hypothetical protein
MREVINDRFLMMSLITNELSLGIDKELEYDYWEVLNDTALKVSNFYDEINLDRRTIAVGAEPRIHIWDIMSGGQNGWNDHIYIATGLYSLMLIQLLEPKKALIFHADTAYNVSAVLSHIECDITFANNIELLFFEKFIKNSKSYPFKFDYKVVNMQEILLGKHDVKYDFISLQFNEFTLDDEMIDTVIDALNPGGVLWTTMANESGRLYSDDFYVEPIVDIYEKILSRTDITTYHIPSSVGFQVVVKNK